MTQNISIEAIDYNETLSGYRLSNGEIELVVTTNVGPRIIRAGFVGEPNLFAELPHATAPVGDRTWHIYGGHRLWVAPEGMPRSYYPDNDPVAVELVDNGLTVTAPIEDTTRLQKQMTVALSAETNQVTITHRITNKGPFAVQMAPWSLSVMAAGGVGLLPLPSRGTHPEMLVPTSTLTIWPFTNMSDVRWTWGEKVVMLRQDSTRTNSQKVGATVPDGWIAYANNGFLFIKRFEFDAGANYPDLMSSAELFTNHEMLELETLGGLTLLEPEATVEHVERWSLHRDIAVPSTPADVQATVVPHV